MTIDNIVNGLAFGSLLFVLASGFTLALGLIKVINIAHGALYMLGVYVALEVTRGAGSFALAIVASSAALMVFSLVLYRLFLRKFELQPLPQVLFTFGVTLVIVESVRLIWGGYPEVLETPGFLSGSVHVGSVIVPTYRVFVMGVAVVLFVALWLAIVRTRVGATVRACIDDQEMARSMGIDVGRVFMLMFAFAGLLAGFSGAIGAPFLGSYQGVEFEVLTLTLVAVVVGGAGSVTGAFIGCMLIGVIDAVGKDLLPDLATFLLFGPMILILALRPTGLMGTEE